MFECTKAILIDLDNVLYDTELFHYMSWKTMCSETGLPFDREQFKELKGLGEAEGLEKVLSFNPRFHAPPALKAMLSTKVRLLYRQYLVSLTPAEVRDDIRDALSALRGKYRVLVYSSGENAGNVLEKLGLDESVDHIFDSRIVSPRERDTEAFTEMAALLCLSPEDCTVIESTASGIESARAVGMMTVGVGAEGVCADKAISVFPEILNIL